MEVVFEQGGLARLAAHLTPWGVRRVLLLASSSRRFVDPALAACSGLEVRVSAAGRVLDVGVMGLQHGLAHRIGGHFDLPHAAVHSALLPAFLTWLRRDQPDLMSAVDRRAGVSHLEIALVQRLRSVRVPARPRELPVSATALQALLAQAGEAPLPAALVQAVLAEPPQA